MAVRSGTAGARTLPHRAAGRRPRKPDDLHDPKNPATRTDPDENFRPHAIAAAICRRGRGAPTRRAAASGEPKRPAATGACRRTPPRSASARLTSCPRTGAEAFRGDHRGVLRAVRGAEDRVASRRAPHRPKLAPTRAAKRPTTTSRPVRRRPRPVGGEQLAAGGALEADASATRVVEPTSAASVPESARLQGRWRGQPMPMTRRSRPARLREATRRCPRRSDKADPRHTTSDAIADLEALRRARRAG